MTRITRILFSPSSFTILSCWTWFSICLLESSASVYWILQILKLVQDDHAAHDSLDADDTDDTDFNLYLSFIICHAELVSASGYWTLQILKLVQDDHAAHDFSDADDTDDADLFFSSSFIILSCWTCFSIWLLESSDPETSSGWQRPTPSFEPLPPLSKEWYTQRLQGLDG